MMTICVASRCGNARKRDAEGTCIVAPLDSGVDSLKARAHGVESWYPRVTAFKALLRDLATG